MNNATPEYYKEHLSKKCQATLVLESPAIDENGNQKTDKDGKPVNYTYTIYLTIEYVEVLTSRVASPSTTVPCLVK